MIEAKDIKRTFLMGKVEVQALKGVSLNIEKGEFVAIVGSSGSGKTTMLNQLGILDTPTSGQIIIDSTNVSELSDREKIRFRLNNLGYVFQDYALIPTLTAHENVYLPLMMQGYPQKELEEKATNILEDVGLSERMHHLPSEMSGGQQQRVSIARALVHEPKILFILPMNHVQILTVRLQDRCLSCSAVSTRRTSRPLSWLLMSSGIWITLTELLL